MVLSYQAAFLRLPEAAAIVNAQGIILEVSDSFERLVGSSRAELCGSAIQQHCSGVDPDGDGLSISSGWESALLWSNGDSNTTLLSTRVVDITMSGSDSPLYMVVVESAPDARPQSLSHKDIHRGKLEALGLKASSIAHDLNNLFAGILGHVSYLRFCLDEVEQAAASLQAIDEGTRRAAGLAKEVLSFSRRERNPEEKVDVQSVVEATLRVVKTSLPESIRVAESLPAEPCIVLGDESQVHQLLANLIVNARDAMPSGGEIHVGVSRIKVGPRLEDSVPPGDYIRLTVRDTGVGIPAHLKDEIFKPFFTTKKDRGTGLGLSIVLSIVEAHSGILQVHSSPGQGTEFEIFLPAHQSDNAVQKAEKQMNEIPRGASERILVVDDEESVRHIIQRSLEHLGYRVEVAADGEEAWEIYKRDRDGFALVILDMIMPKMSGDEVFFKLKELDPAVAVLVSSGYSSDSRTKAILSAGGKGIIQKPFAIEELAREVKRCINGES